MAWGLLGEAAEMEEGLWGRSTIVRDVRRVRLKEERLLIGCLGLWEGRQRM